MAHWLIKSEPSVWSWDDQVKAGAKGTHWDGVKNHTAKLNLMAMKKGDQVFFYHSNEGLEIVGIVEVIREAYPWEAAGPPWVLVDFKAVKPLPKPVEILVGEVTRVKNPRSGREMTAMVENKVTPARMLDYGMFEATRSVPMVRERYSSEISSRAFRCAVARPSPTRTGRPLASSSMCAESRARVAWASRTLSSV